MSARFSRPSSIFSRPGLTLGEIERFEFYERAKKAFVVIQSGEERQYGNLLLVKGCVL